MAKRDDDIMPANNGAISEAHTPKTVDASSEADSGRRQFLIKAATAATALAVSTVLPTQALGAAMSQDEIQSMADRITNVATLNSQCGPHWCPSMFHTCVEAYYLDCAQSGVDTVCDLSDSICTTKYCPDDWCQASYGCSGPYCEGTWCPNIDCEVSYNTYCPTFHTPTCPYYHTVPCTSHYCVVNFCQTKYCTNTDANCQNTHCLGYFCPTKFCPSVDSIDPNCTVPNCTPGVFTNC